MEIGYLTAMFVSAFSHCMGLFYCPAEASTDSVLFIIMAIMCLNKLKVMYNVMDSEKAMEKITECVVLCLLMQVLLISVWFPVHKIVQILVDPVKATDVTKYYAVSVGVLAIELAVMLSVFEIDDVQRLYGNKEDLVSDSVLSVLTKQEKLVMRREARLRRK